MELLDVLSHHLWIIVGYLGVAFAVSSASVLAQTPPGSEIYKQHCAECHGENGEGVKGKYDDPLEGNRTIDSLTRYIDRYMPEDKPELLDTAQARQVAEYVSATFYAKRSESNAAGHQKISFVRLTNRQFRESVADLIGSFDCTSAPGDGSGLHAEYFQSDGMDKKPRKLSRGGIWPWNSISQKQVPVTTSIPSNLRSAGMDLCLPQPKAGMKSGRILRTRPSLYQSV